MQPWKLKVSLLLYTSCVSLKASSIKSISNVVLCYYEQSKDRLFWKYKKNWNRFRGVVSFFCYDINIFFFIAYKQFMSQINNRLKIEVIIFKCYDISKKHR